MKIIENIYQNITTFLTINFTLLAFILTALTILLMINKGRIKEFKKSNLLLEVTKKFKLALDFNFLSGIFALIGVVLNFDNFIFKSFISLSVIIFFSFALFYTYKTYIWIIYFINNSNY